MLSAPTKDKQLIVCGFVEHIVKMLWFHTSNLIMATNAHENPFGDDVVLSDVLSEPLKN